jgi:hypothetical protein
VLSLDFDFDFSALGFDTAEVRNLKTDLNDLMKKRIVIREDGEARRISRQEAVLLSLFGKAARGDVRASTTLVNMVMKLNAETSDGSQPSDISYSDWSAQRPD